MILWLTVLVIGAATFGLRLTFLARGTPGTLPPLTGEKITAWKKAGGASLVGFEKHSEFPVAYGEINPMRSETDHFWIGHVVVDSQLRGRGVGRRFVRRLLEEAFHKQHARCVSLVVFPENQAAVHCYRRCGFACGHGNGFGR